MLPVHETEVIPKPLIGAQAYRMSKPPLEGIFSLFTEMPRGRVFSELDLAHRESKSPRLSTPRAPKSIRLSLPHLTPLTTSTEPPNHSAVLILLPREIA